MNDKKNERRILAISSPGGHWVQMRILAPSWHGMTAVYASTDASLADDIGAADFHVVPDASRRSPLAVLRLAFAVFALLLRVRPQVIVTTGAAPGGLAIVFGRLLGITTIWIDSVANAEEVSLSGRLFGRIAHVWLTQWQHLARPSGPTYFGSVL